MADSKKPKLEAITSPKGVFKYPRVNEPDYKFAKEMGKYSAKVVVSESAVAGLREKLAAAANKALEEARAELTEKVATEKGEKKAKAKKALEALALGDLPIKPTYDDDGEPDGNVEMVFNMAAHYKDKKTDELKPLTVKFFDADGNLIKGKKPDVWGGTVGRVSGHIKPFYNPAGNTAGVSLRLSAVQIIELVSGGGGSAEQFGFGKEEGGYSHVETADDTPKAAKTQTEGDESNAGGDDTDF